MGFKFLNKLKKCRFEINSSFGFSLLETLVALAIFTMGILGPLNLAAYSIRIATYARNQTIAYYLAQEVVEYIRFIRDSNSLNGDDWLRHTTFASINHCWGAGGCYIDVYAGTASSCGANCPKIRYDPVTGLYNYSIGAETIFTRKVNIEPDFDCGGTCAAREYEAELTVEISWDERFLSKTFVIQEHIFDWK
jgi:hypothetical protein